MIRDRMKPIAGGVNFWPHRSLSQFRKVNSATVVKKVFRISFQCLLSSSCLFFSSNLKLQDGLLKTLIPPNPWICSAARRRTNIEPKRIHPLKMDISLFKTWFFSTSTKDQKVQRRYALKSSTRNEKGIFFLPINETLTINSPLPHFRLTSLNRRGPENVKRVFKSNPKLIPAQSNTRFEIRLMPRLSRHNTCA